MFIINKGLGPLWFSLDLIWAEAHKWTIQIPYKLGFLASALTPSSFFAFGCPNSYFVRLSMAEQVLSHLYLHSVYLIFDIFILFIYLFFCVAQTEKAFLKQPKVFLRYTHKSDLFLQFCFGFLSILLFILPFVIVVLKFEEIWKGKEAWKGRQSLLEVNWSWL